MAIVTDLVRNVRSSVTAEVADASVDRLHLPEAPSFCGNKSLSGLK